MNDHKLVASRLSVASAVLFLVLVVLQLATGANQHFFELVHAPPDYARLLVEKSSWLKLVFAIDDVFITCYVSATLFTALSFPRKAASYVAIALVAAAGLLDLEENHHLLALIDAARAGLEPSAAELVRRMDFSSVKWALGHIGFFFFAFFVPGEDALAKAFRWMLVFVQLPLGVAGVVYGDLKWLALLRALNLFVGFLVLAALVARKSERAGSSAPASLRGTTPATAG
jgi:hypothetical protein